MRFIILLCAFMPIYLNAQLSPQTWVEIGSGYEYNIFNAPGQSIAQPIRSNFYQSLKWRTDWRFNPTDHIILLGLRGQYNFFPGIRDANLFRPRVQIDYRWLVNNDGYLFAKARYDLYRTQRGSDPTELLNIPTSYQNAEGSLGYNMQVSKLHQMRITGSCRNRSYAPLEERRLSYQSWGLELRSRHRIPRDGKLSSYLTLTADVSRRYYQQRALMEGFDEEFEEEEEFVDEDISEPFRLWDYRQVEGKYSFRTGNQHRWEIGLLAQQRVDQLDEELGYRQWRSSLSWRASFGKLELQCKTSYTGRFFSELPATSAGEELLIHRYLRTAFSATYELSNNWQLNGQWSSIKRWRNHASTATTFLPYLNSDFRVALRYQW